MRAANGSPDAWGLVQAAQRGDRAAFGQLYTRYAPGVSRFLSNRVRDHGLVEDLTSETFLRGWRRLDSVSDQGKDIGAWLTTIARNLVFDHSKSSRSKLDTPVAQVHERDIRDRGPEQRVIDRETADQLRHHVAQLTPDQQQSIRHRFFDDLSVTETAAAMGRNEGAVKALQHRGITALRAAMTAATAPVPPPRQRVHPLASTRKAVGEVHQLAAGEDPASAERDRAHVLARWHAADQGGGPVEQRDHDRDALTAGGAA